jgi:hypothetical protein
MLCVSHSSIIYHHAHSRILLDGYLHRVTTCVLDGVGLAMRNYPNTEGSEQTPSPSPLPTPNSVPFPTSINIAIPVTECQRTWQCKSQTPTFSARNRSTAYPRLGMLTVSRSAARERSYGVNGFPFALLSSSVTWSEWPREKDADEGESRSRHELACGGDLSVKGL